MRNKSTFQGAVFALTPAFACGCATRVFVRRLVLVVFVLQSDNHVHSEAIPSR